MPATTFIGHFLGPDIHANRPTASGVPNGTLYVCTTHQKIERVVSGAWVDYATLGVTAGSAVVATDPIWDTKGDLAVATGADAAAKLPAGANGYVLTADSTQTTGVKWASLSSLLAGITFRSMNFLSDSSGTTHACPMPAGVVAGDVLIMIAHAWGGGTPTLTTPTGWTSRGFHNPGADVFGCYTRVADGSEGASVTVTASVSTMSNIGILAYSGATGVDAVTDFGSTQSTATPTIPSVTTTVANGMVVGVAGFQGATSATPAAGWTERLDHNASSGSGGLIYAMERAQPTAGVSPTAVVTGTGVSGIEWTWAVAIK